MFPELRGDAKFSSGDLDNDGIGETAVFAANGQTPLSIYSWKNNFPSLIATGDIRSLITEQMKTGANYSFSGLSVNNGVITLTLADDCIKKNNCTIEKNGNLSGISTFSFKIQDGKLNYMKLR